MTSTRKKRTKEPDIPTVEVLSNISKVRMLSPSLILLEIPSDTNTDLPVWSAMRSQQVHVAWTVSAYSINVLVTPMPSTVAPKAAKTKRCSDAANGTQSTYGDPSPMKRPRLRSDARKEAQSTSGDPSPVTRPRLRSDARKEAQSASGDPLPTKQPRITIQHIPLTQNTSNVLLTVLPSSLMACSPVNPFAQIKPAKNNSFFCPLPLIISQPQPATQTNSPPAKKALSSRQTPARTSKRLATAKSPALENFHTKQACDIQICDEFLLNVCHKGERCEMHHTPYPFHWQLFERDGQWVDLNPRAQLCLERHYCNVNMEKIEIKDGGNRLSLNLDLMKVNNKKGNKYKSVRRLSNTSDPTRNPHFPTKWRIYRLKSGIWEEYKKKESKLLLRKMADKEPECTIHIDTGYSKEYKVDFGDMTETNVDTGTIRRILCRPTYRSLASMEPYLPIMTGTPSEPPDANFNVDPLEDFACWYPPVWSLVPHQDYMLVDVPTGTQAFLKVQNLFHQSLPETEIDIISIQQIQNLLHWDKFQRHKAYMKQNSISADSLERHFFHGTTSEAVPQICRDNFDPRVSGINGSAYGQGSYFSLDASYCHWFSVDSEDGVRHMFLAKVLVGNTTRGSSTYRRPPQHTRSGQKVLYDTCVDSVSKPSMFVVFDSCQCYPYYLIKYKDLPLKIDITQ